MYPDAEKIILVEDNLNTHNPASLYKKFSPEKARELISRIEWHYTPKHGSWLNMAEIEISILARTGLSQRIPSLERFESIVKKNVATSGPPAECWLRPMTTPTTPLLWSLGRLLMH